ncbi:MAG: UDP-galactopyranose mutase [Armatimonadetes bacterium]|nr:UDP-galactopyranose mutase [Akkermansiaceae bacterium]
MTFDYLIVGAGFAGLASAERLCALGKRCLVVEKRTHLGGNAYDRYDDNGVLIHPYGPHYFRTNSPRIREYLSRFTEWHPVNYQILSHTEGRYWNFPINLNTFEQYLGRPSTGAEMEEWLATHRVQIERPANSEEVIISQVGWELYEMFFKGYTLKQWKRHPKDLDASVCGRIPIRTNRDNRYLQEEFQALPKGGYTPMFERMVGACGDRISILLNTDYRTVLPHVEYGHMIYTGPIDEFYDCRYGGLPYRSLRFEYESFSPEQLKDRESIAGKPGFWQPALQVNYPNDHDFTRIVEVKHATGQLCSNSTIVREFPEDYGPGKEPYYPVPAPDATAIYQRYKELADAEQGVSFIGRLATYRYYNMDQVVGMALAEVDRLHPSSTQKIPTSRQT